MPDVRVRGDRSCRIQVAFLSNTGREGDRDHSSAVSIILKGVLRGPKENGAALWPGAARKCNPPIFLDRLHMRGERECRKRSI